MPKGKHENVYHAVLKSIDKFIGCLLACSIMLAATSPAQGNQPAVIEATTEGDTPSSVTVPSVAQARAAQSRPKLALVLAGGGARGLAHIGVLKVLEREGIHVDFISGTSVGALIGSLSAAQLSAHDIEAIALDGKLGKAFFPRAAVIQEIVYLPSYVCLRVLQLKPALGLYSGKSIAKFVRKNIPAQYKNIEQLPTPFVAVSVDLSTGAKFVHSKGNIAKAVQASCSVPFLYRPVKDGSRYMVDGGISSNLPTAPAEATGAIVLAVRLHGYTEKESRNKFDTTLEFADRVTSILMASVEEKSITSADILIEPKVEKFDLGAFKREEMLEAIAAGETAALAALPDIRRVLNNKMSAQPRLEH